MLPWRRPPPGVSLHHPGESSPMFLWASAPDLFISLIVMVLTCFFFFFKKACVGLGIENILSETMRSPLLRSKRVNSPPKGGGPQTAPSHQSTPGLPASRDLGSPSHEAHPCSWLPYRHELYGKAIFFLDTEQKENEQAVTQWGKVSGLTPHPSWWCRKQDFFFPAPGDLAIVYAEEEMSL